MSEQPAKSYGDSLNELRTLANRWALLARDHAREAKSRTEARDEAKASYYRGLAEAYYKLAMELANVVKLMPDEKAIAETVASAEGSAAESSYATVPLSEALRVLDYAGVSARDVKQHPDNVFSAVFSRWQPFSEAERIDLICGIDPRVVIVAYGKLPETHDPYVDFAFRKE